jgi:PAS domain S-box-containing protein
MDNMVTQKALIVDLGISDSDGLEERLRALGYEVVATSSLGEAERLVGAAAPDVVLLDAALAGGHDLVQAPDAPRALPLVVLGHGDDRAERSNGLDDVERPPQLSAPFTDRELLLAIELARTRHRAGRAVSELEGFFAVSVDLFCFLDFNGHFRRLNPAWERTLGFTLQELMSRPFIDFVHPDDRERTLRENAAVRAGGQALLFENRYVCKDGSYRWFLWNATPHPDQRVIYSAARDITSRKEAEAERARLVAELEASAAEVRHLQEILPICSYCRKIRGDEDYWHEVEDYIAQHTSSRFSHSICPECMTREVEPDLAEAEDRAQRASSGDPAAG